MGEPDGRVHPDAAAEGPPAIAEDIVLADIALGGVAVPARALRSVTARSAAVATSCVSQGARARSGPPAQRPRSIALAHDISWSSSGPLRRAFNARRRRALTPARVFWRPTGTHAHRDAARPPQTGRAVQAADGPPHRHQRPAGLASHYSPDHVRPPPALFPLASVSTFLSPSPVITLSLLRFCCMGEHASIAALVLLWRAFSNRTRN